MSIRGIARRATVVGYATPTNAPVFVDSADNILKFIPAGSGTTAVQIVDVSKAQTLTNKTLTSPIITGAAISGATGAEAAVVVTTTNPITAAQSGTTFYLSATGGFTSTLPAPALGLVYRFVVKTAPTGASYIITTTSGSNLLFGMFVERAGGAGVAGAAQDTQNFVVNNAIVGDWAEYRSDGTNWYLHGMVNVIAGATFAVT